MKNILAILALLALIVNAISTHTCTCSCGQQQGYEQDQPQKHHRQQQGHAQQQKYHHHQQIPMQPQQQIPEQPRKHHQLYQGDVHQQPPQDQHHQQCHEQPQQQHGQSHDEPSLQHQPSQQGCEKQPCEQIHDKQQITRCGSSYYSGTQNLNNCHEFLRQQCNPRVIPFLQSHLLQPSRCQVLGHQCCQEVRQLEPCYLHQAISNMVWAIIREQQEKQQPHGFGGPQQASQNEEVMLTAAQYLPSMCGMHNSCCQNNQCGNKETTSVHN
ncbi:hypothetical protein HU200_037592 [Digitaria exilis]|uniref:Bifunctional inhibitor/plant lipid transfer protein/seed storage helical domain-containing protein n=1 Tax=Digitaria exilis TaxID=1010633 RepID=A0A835BD60_9POAL|nr:hypothetical protein HU200_037592 [Digitaria exilis]